MNIIEAVKILRSNESLESKTWEYIDAVEAMDVIVAQYDALAPTPEMWAEYPWAQWYAIDCHNAGFWFDDPEPLITYDDETYDAPTWANSSLCKFAVHIGLLPFGIDWRLCKWQRPEVTSPQDALLEKHKPVFFNPDGTGRI